MMSYITKKNIPCQSCMWELKPALGQFGEPLVEQARSLAQDWQAEVGRGGDP